MADSKREWMIGHQGHTGLLTVEEVANLIRGGQLREQEMVKRQGQPWRAAREVPELAAFFKNPGHGAMTAAIKDAPAPEPAEPPPPPEDRTILYPAPAVLPAKSEAKPAAKPTVAERPTRFRRLASYRGTDRKEAPKPAPPAAAAPPAPPPKAGSSPPLDVDVKDVVEEAERLSAESSATYPAIKPEEPAAAAAPPPPIVEPAKPEPKVAPKQSSRRAMKAVAPPAPTMAPMPAKYYSPAELVRDTSLAFSLRKLATVLGILLPALFLSFLLYAIWARAARESPRAQEVLNVIPHAILGLGVCAALASATYLTRRELEHAPGGGLAVHLARVLPGLVAIAAGAAAAYALLRGVLWVLGWIRNLSVATAAILRFLEILPLLFAGLAVGAAVGGGLALAYSAAAAAVEGCTPIGGLKHLRSMARDQGRRLAMHAFIIVVATGAAAFACHYLVFVEMWPLIHANPPPMEIIAHWRGYWGLDALYERGLLLSLVWALPVSLLCTMAVLSYCALRQPEGAQLPASGKPDETSTNESGATEKAAPSAMEQTTPSATRPGEEKVEELPEPDVQPSTAAPPAPAPPPPAGPTPTA